MSCCERGIPADGLMRRAAADFGAFANLADEHLDDLDLPAPRRAEGDGIGEGIVGRKERVAGVEQVRRKAGRARERRRNGEGACLSLAVGGEGGFRHVAADDRVAHEMDARLQLRLECRRVDWTPAASFGKACPSAIEPRLLRRNDVGDRRLEGFVFGDHRQRLRVDRLTPPMNCAGSHSIMPG